VCKEGVANPLIHPTEQSVLAVGGLTKLSDVSHDAVEGSPCRSAAEGGQQALWNRPSRQDSSDDRDEDD
jgi:hypothetical protein